ncbi:MAG TPA: hypothetical protein VKV03_12445 [Candidatus Binataceae bacterium]|nr:hypothetical protein [Candidatus Binataceae bacterium]
MTIFVVALTIRLIAIEVSGANRISFGDAGDYIASAQSLCVQHAYPDRGNLPFFRAPGLPFFIAGATACHASAVRAIKYALSACDALTCVLIAAIALMLFDRRAAWIAGVIASIHPIFVAQVCDVRSEPLFMLLLTLAIFLLLRNSLAGSGIAVALAALTRPSAMLCIPLFALYRPRRAHVLLIASALTLAPWMIRNFVRFDKIIVVNDAGGFGIWRGTHPDVIALTHEGDRAKYGQEAREFEVRTIAAARGDWTRLAIENIRAHPREEALFTIEKAWLYWRPWLNPMEYSTRIVAASAAFIIPLYVFGFTGIVRARRWDVLVFFAAMWLAHLPFQMGMRLRVPFTDPLLIAFAASLFVHHRGDEGDDESPLSTQSSQR